MTIRPETVDPEEARRAAGDVLDQAKYRAGFQPIRDLFRWIGKHVVDPIRRLLPSFAGGDGDGGFGVATIVAIVVIVLAIVLIVRLAVLRGRTASEMFARRTGRTGDDAETPDALERRADDAERRGELELALRLRFRAGLLRLDRAGVLELRPSQTNSTIEDHLDSPEFSTVAHRFNEIVYGRRPVNTHDLDATREVFRTLLTERRSRVRA